MFDLRPVHRRLARELPASDLERLRSSVLHPATTAFGAGFYGEEGDGTSRWRWGTSEGEVVLTNPGNRSVSVRLAFGVDSPDDESRVTVSGLPGKDVVLPAGADIDRVLELRPGRTVVRMRSDAAPQVVPGDTRTSDSASRTSGSRLPISRTPLVAEAWGRIPVSVADARGSPRGGRRRVKNWVLDQRRRLQMACERGPVEPPAAVESLPPSLRRRLPKDGPWQTSRRCSPLWLDDNPSGSPVRVRHRSLYRFLQTWGLVRSRRGAVLEIGANPYFMSFALRRFTNSLCTCEPLRRPEHGSESFSQQLAGPNVRHAAVRRPCPREDCSNSRS